MLVNIKKVIFHMNLTHWMDTHISRSQFDALRMSPKILLKSADGIHPEKTLANCSGKSHLIGRQQRIPLITPHSARTQPRLGHGHGHKSVGRWASTMAFPLL